MTATQAPTPGPLSDGMDAYTTPEAIEAAIGRLAPTAPVEASGSEREHGPKCWGKTSLSDEMAHCYCGSTDLRPQPSGETREAVARLTSLADDAEAMSLDIAVSNYVGSGGALVSDLRALIRPAPVASEGQHSGGEESQ